MRAKVKADIEKLLVWAYRDELSKRVTSVGESNWGRIQGYGQRGGMKIDGGGPQRYDLGEVHEDAARIEIAVARLGKVAVDWLATPPEELLGDYAGLWKARDVLLLRSIDVQALVMHHAIQESRPDWYEPHERPGRTDLRTKAPTWPFFVPSKKNGAEPMLVGERGGRNLYKIGSHTLLRWEPSPITIALARADYAAWHHGLCVLADTLELEAHEVEQPAAPAQPWKTGEAGRRILWAAGGVLSPPS